MSVNDPTTSIIERNKAGMANEQLLELFDAADKSARAS